ncbi:MAG: dephospho-CoA kinase [Bacteroidales bacterium]|nr:dephospho-CoA kinase [Bacteroidales bacterium]
MRVLGCTGGIGSGKSYIANIFNKMGIPVYDSDNRAKALYDTDPLLLKQMVDLLGDAIVENGIIQRNIIASMIFADKALLAEVEKLVHPAVVRDFNIWKESFGQTAVPFVIMESAILLEKPLVKECTDRVVTVTAPFELRVERVMERDKTERQKVLDRMAVQWSDEKRMAMADFIIFADGKRALLPQIRKVYDAMCSL